MRLFFLDKETKQDIKVQKYKKRKKKSKYNCPKKQLNKIEIQNENTKVQKIMIIQNM